MIPSVLLKPWMYKRADVRPDGSCEMRPSRIIKDYNILLTLFQIYVLCFIYVLHLCLYFFTSGSLRICTR